jgi:3-methylcrotonyl-CoA carboxylase alpha subunit
VGAGTVEFIVEQPGGYDQPDAMKFYFMEMNTRLQVEHPVTEAITGEDLVAWQLQVAAGLPLPKQQGELKIVGHAIEARICAENPDNNFLPATGTLNVYRKPACSSFAVGDVRMDDGVREGDAISPFYDSMIAKLIVRGDDRAQALARLDAALAQVNIVGVTNNVQFLRHVLATDSFATAKLDTALIEREAARLFKQTTLAPELAAAAAVAWRLQREQRMAASPHGRHRDPFAQPDGWQSHALSTRRFAFEQAGEPLPTTLSYLHDGALRLQVGTGANEGAAQLFSWRRADSVNGARSGPEQLDITLGSQRLRARVFVQAAGGQSADTRISVFTAQGMAELALQDQMAHAGEGSSEGGQLTAPMPGKVLSFAVKAGDAVKKGQPLAVMEAMKMEHTIAAPSDGVVGELLFAPGDQVTEGAALLSLANEK